MCWTIEWWTLSTTIRSDFPARNKYYEIYDIFGHSATIAFGICHGVVNTSAGPVVQEQYHEFDVS